MSFFQEIAVLGAIPLPTGTELRVRLVSFRGFPPVVDVRLYTKRGDPTFKGVFLPPGQVWKLIQLLERAQGDHPPSLTAPPSGPDEPGSDR